MDLDEGAIDWVTTCILDAIARADTIEPTPLIFLLHHYAASGRDDLGEALGEALAAALVRPTVPGDRARWLMLFAEASLMSDDDRVRTASADLASSLGGEQQNHADLAAAAEAVEARLISADAGESRELIASAIDDLERIVGPAYRPGDGIGHQRGEPDRERGRLDDQVRAASCLLTAYALTARLPYSMLAEELLQFARRALWDDQGGGFYETRLVRHEKPFALNCEAARVLCRLDRLRRDDNYRRAAVVAPASDYTRDAARTLASQTPNLRQRGLDAAIYALALLDLRPNLQ